MNTDVTDQGDQAFSHAQTGTPESVWRADPVLAEAEDLDLSRFQRLVVAAAHPDDESLMAGGLIASAAARGMTVDVVVASAGEASHPDSPTHDRERLARLRQDEVTAAVHALAPSAHLHLLGLRDGHLSEDVPLVLARLVELIAQQGSETLLVSTLQEDRHPDHAAVAEAAAGAAWRTDATHLEAPLWLWHWGDSNDLSALAASKPLVRLTLSAEARAAKRAAMAAHTTQISPLSPHPGDETLLGPSILAHFERPFEILCRPTPGELSPFDDLHRGAEDPWQTQTSWYEERKRALTLAVLPQRRYASALEIGCSVGVLARDLAARSDEVIGVDESTVALEHARRTVAGTGVELLRCQVPEEWPQPSAGRQPDLVVVSEIGYFLSPGRMALLAERIAASGATTVIACHWRHRIVGWPLTVVDVHAALDEALTLPRVTTVSDADFELVVWSSATTDEEG